MPVTTNDSPLNPGRPDMNPDMAPNEILIGFLYLLRPGLDFSVPTRSVDCILLNASMAIGMLRTIKTTPMIVSRSAVERRLEKYTPNRALHIPLSPKVTPALTFRFPFSR